MGNPLKVGITRLPSASLVVAPAVLHGSSTFATMIARQDWLSPLTFGIFTATVILLGWFGMPVLVPSMGPARIARALSAVPAAHLTHSVCRQNLHYASVFCPLYSLCSCRIRRSHVVQPAARQPFMSRADGLGSRLPGCLGIRAGPEFSSWCLSLSCIVAVQCAVPLSGY